MKVDKQIVEHVAELARLKLTDAEIEKFIPQLNEILDAFSKIENAKGGKPSFQPVELKNVMREDKAGECLTNAEALSNTQHKKDGYFKGPKVV